MKVKTDPKQYVQFDNPRSGCGLGCWSIGCMGIIGLFMMIGIGGYYGVFHSSLPLRLIEAAVEQEGEVEIEGLEGTLSSGFSADELRFKTMDDQWSNLTDIKFKYEGNSSLFGNDRFVISELSVNGGTIYADWDPEENELDPDFREEFDEISDEVQDADDEFREEFGASSGVGEVRIDLVRVANLKIINPTTELELSIDEIKFDGFEWKDGELMSVGELLVRSSQMELTTVPSLEFPDQKHARRFEGVLRAQADRRLQVDVPFVVDFVFDDQLELTLKSTWFDGQLLFDRQPAGARLSFNDFSPVEIVKLDNGVILPADVNLNLEYQSDEEFPSVVNSDGTFKLGKTQFSNLRIDQPEQGSASLLADADLNGKLVTARIKFDRSIWESWQVKLESSAFAEPGELWAQTVYQSAYRELSEDQQLIIQAAINSLAKLQEQEEDDTESKDETVGADRSQDGS